MKYATAYKGPTCKRSLLADSNAGLAQFAGFVKCNPTDRPAAAFLSKLINGGNKRYGYDIRRYNGRTAGAKVYEA